MSRARAIGSIAGHAAAAAWRAPLVGLLLWLALLLAGFLPTLQSLAFLEQRRMAELSVLSLALVALALLAVAVAEAAWGQPWRRGVLPLLLVRPLGPGGVAAGHALGAAAALLVCWLPLAVAVLWASRVRYGEFHPDPPAVRLYFALLLLALPAARRVALPWALAGLLGVGGAALAGAAPGLVDWGLLAPLWLTVPAALLALALALVLLSWLDLAPALLLCLVLCATPGWQVCWVADALPSGFRVTAEYGLRALGYAVAWLAAATAVLTWVLERERS